MEVSSNKFALSDFSDFLEIDSSQAIKQLQLLGYQRGDAIYIRAFLPKEDPRYAPNTGRKADKLNFKQILEWQQQGYGIYFVINGGGHKDEDVQLCRAVFIEHDDLAIELQKDLWQTLSLPEPTFQIQTRKSVHSYWVFEKPIPVEEWKQLQNDLLTYTGADPAIKNPSRVMRLAGAWHIKPGEKPQRCDIISLSGINYTYEKLRSSVPLSQNPELIQREPKAVQSTTRTFAQEQQYTRYANISVPVPVPVPLEVCLSKESRTLLNFGVNEGGRNNNGAKLARDLIGAANYLTKISQQFDGDPQLMLQDYASRCHPPLPAKEVDAIWKSAEKDHPEPSCTPNGVETCIRAWYWNTRIKPNQNSLASSGSPPRNSGFGNVSSVGKKPAIADVALHKRILEILSSCDSESGRAGALMELAAEVGCPYRQIEQFAKLLTLEADLQTDTLVATQKLSSLLKTHPQELDLTRLIEPEFAQLLMDTAQAMPTAPEFLFTTLLGTAASRIGSAARVIVKPSAKYAQPMVMWTSIVADSGSMKTPAQRLIIDPLVELEAEAFERYRMELAEYNKLQTVSKGKKQDSSQQEMPTAPTRQRYLTKDSTLETLQRIHSENPRGLLYYRDELAGLFKARNQYRGGLGADEEQELDQFNGAAIIYDRSDKSVCLPKSAISRTGSIQWEVLAKMMGDHNDSNGNFARWLFCAAKSPKRYLRLVGESSVADTGISQALRQLYIKLGLVPEQDYFLSTQAAMFFEAWQHSLVDAQVAEESYGLRVVYPKIEAYTARISLWLHIVNAVLRGETPSQVICGDTMEKAIELAAYFLWQHKSIHAQNSPESGLMSWGLKIQKVAERLGEATASMLKSSIRAFRKKPTFEIRQLMEMMAAAGWGRVENKGSNLVYVPNSVPLNEIDKIDRNLTPVSILQTQTTPGFDNEIDSFDAKLAAPISSEKVTSCHSISSLRLEDLELRQFVNSNAQMLAEEDTDLIDTNCQLKRQLSTDEWLNIEFLDNSHDDSSQFLGGNNVPSPLPSNGNAAEALSEILQESTEILGAKVIVDSNLPNPNAQTDQDVIPIVTGKNLNNRKLQRVEVLTTAGEWITGYFIDACVTVGNFVGQSRRFSLFDADGTMHVFEGQIRTASSG